MARKVGWPAAKPSTRAFFEEARRLPGYSLLDRLHGYFYGRWPYLYIGVATGEHWLARPLGALSRLLSRRPRRSDKESRAEDARRDFADGYHGKVVRLDQARVLVTLNEEISLPVPEQVLPYSRARDIVLRNPDHIVALDCPCRASRPSPCRPLDICLIVGEPFASFVVEHNPGRARWISQQRAEQILHEEHERGHVHHAFFKDAMLERFYAICNCCSCCCGAMQAFRNGTPMLASSGYVSRIDPQSCIYCERCADACPFDAVSMGDAAAWVDDQLCMGCGVCVSRCDWNAVELVRDPSKGEPLAVHELMVSAG